MSHSTLARREREKKAPETLPTAVAEVKALPQTPTIVIPPHARIARMVVVRDQFGEIQELVPIYEGSE